LVAYVVPTPGAAIRPDRLRAFLKERLPEYMVPSAFVALERLPLSPNGKVDRRALPVPGESRPPAKVFIAPRTRAEELLAGIFGQVLRLKRVSVEDDFFDLGGHSLLATGVVARIRDAFGIELPVRGLFEAPSVAQLAALVARALETRAGTDLGQVLAQVEQLSDEEVAKMLAVSKERKPGDA
jgi:acyl carrier protein